MHAHPDPGRLLAVAAAAIGLMLATLALPSGTADLDLRLGGAGSHVDATHATAPAIVRPEPARPRWLADPLDPPAFAQR